ncbi:MAG: hypothetical protein WC505_02300 [Patescibacteria group bacterium]
MSVADICIMIGAVVGSAGLIIFLVSLKNKKLLLKKIGLAMLIIGILFLLLPIAGSFFSSTEEVTGA